MLYFLFICHLSIPRCKAKWKISRYENIKYNKRRMFTRCNSRDKLIFLNWDVRWCCQDNLSVIMFNSMEYGLRITYRPRKMKYFVFFMNLANLLDIARFVLFGIHLSWIYEIIILWRGIPLRNSWCIHYVVEHLRNHAWPKVLHRFSFYKKLRRI